MKRAFLHLYFKANRSFNEVRMLGEGLKRHGWDVYAGDLTAFTGADLVCQWNIRNGEIVQGVLDTGGEAVILETSYIEPRRDYCSLGFGYGINNRLRHYGPFEDSSRWERLFSERMKPWRVRDSGPVVIMGQTPGDMALREQVNFFDWVYETYAALRELGRDVIFRPHPNMGPDLVPRMARMKRLQKTCVHLDEHLLYRGLHRALEEGMRVEHGEALAAVLDKAKFCVAFNSNSATDSVINGCPAVTMDIGAMAWPVTSHKLDDPVVYPDRTAWAHALAWKQFTLNELESGEAWDAVCPPHLK